MGFRGLKSLLIRKSRSKDGEGRFVRRAQSDNQKSRGNSQRRSRFPGGMTERKAKAGKGSAVRQAEAGVVMTFSKAVWKSCISWGVPTVMRTWLGQMGQVRPM